jgi:hypothetical protein
MQSVDAVQVREEKVDRAYEAGMMGFFERWSRKKALHQKRQEKQSSASSRQPPKPGP